MRTSRSPFRGGCCCSAAPRRRSAALLIGRMAGCRSPQNAKYQLLSESNRVQLIPVPPRRGWIIDRKGKPIAINRSSFRVDLIPQQLVDAPEVVAQVSQLLDADRRRSRPDQSRACGIARFPAGLRRRQYRLRAICRDHRSPARIAGRLRVARVPAFLSGGIHGRSVDRLCRRGLGSRV